MSKLSDQIDALILRITELKTMEDNLHAKKIQLNTILENRLNISVHSMNLDQLIAMLKKADDLSKEP